MKYSMLFFMLFLIDPVWGQSGSDWEPLFNGKDLSGWDTWLGKPHESVQFAVGSEYDPDKPVGLNNDPKGVYTVVDEDKEPAIRISGEIYGAITSQKEFENYHIRLQIKWGTMKWEPRADEIRDSGLIYHATGPHGAGYGNWMKSQECQIQETDCGDYWAVSEARIDIKSGPNQHGDFTYDPNGDVRTFGWETDAGMRCRKNPDNENPRGEWNTIEVMAYGTTSVHIVNGVVNLVLTNSRHLVDGKEQPLTKGKIQIQSEGAEVFYRNIEIRTIDKIPEEYLKTTP